MLSIGITGGIGSGKSTVTSYIASRGFTVVDADAISRDMTRAGSPLLPILEREFGKVLRADGSLDRARLASLAFADPRMSLRLRRIVTDRVIEEMKRRQKRCREEGRLKVLFFDIPLLFETGCDSFLDLVFVVAADCELRISRVMQRDSLTRDQVIARMDNQMSQSAKVDRADEVIDNSTDLSDLYAQIERLILRYDLTR